jgi:hypothetical protein
LLLWWRHVRRHIPVLNVTQFLEMGHMRNVKERSYKSQNDAIGFCI